MTVRYTSSRRLDALLSARATLLELLPTRAAWPEQGLIDAASMTGPFFHAVMQDLLSEGLVDRYPTLDGAHRSASYRLAPEGVTDAPSEPLTPDARRVLDHLRRPTTARHIGEALRLSTATVEAALAVLHEARLVTCRYVGHLNIYRRAE
jgi:DNA-binding transcriptional ArsR family regulator